MILYYAMGGGLGHLTRARAFLYSQNLENSSIILTSSTFADDRRVVGNIPVIKVDKVFEKDCISFRKFLQNTLFELKIKTLFIDSFPFGIIKELADLQFSENLKINYVARLLKWENYAPAEIRQAYKFNKTYILEPLEKEHLEFVNQFSNERIEFDLKYPNANLSLKDKEVFKRISNNKSPFWLIVHTGKREEISELISFADEMREIEKAAVNLILISPDALPVQKSNLFHFNLYPASALFEKAERIFTACGFNAMQQTRNFRDKHFFMPFERRFDDQFERARRFREMAAIP